MLRPRRLAVLTFVTAVIVGCLGARPAAAQVSIWLQRGVSGFGGTFAFTGSKDGLILSLGGGYSFQGFIDFDLSVSRYFPDRDNFGGASVSIWSIAPTIEVHPLKQSADMPISLGLGAGIEIPFYSSEDLAANDISLSAFSFSFSASLYRFFRLGESVGVIPAFSLLFGHTTVTTKTSFDEVSEGNATFGVGLGAYFAFIDSDARIWGLVPSVQITDDYVQFRLAIGAIFSQP